MLSANKQTTIQTLLGMGKSQREIARVAKYRNDVVREALQRVSNQPGFHGEREQSWALCQFVRGRGHTDDLQFLHYLRKVPHGDRVVL